MYEFVKLDGLAKTLLTRHSRCLLIFCFSSVSHHLLSTGVSFSAKHPFHFPPLESGK